MDLYNLYTEGSLTAKEREKLKDSDFGLPKTRQYPIHDEEHTRKAIQMFHHCPEKDRRELAGNIYKAALKFSIIIDKNALVFKYLNEKEQTKMIKLANDKKQTMNESSYFLNFVNFYQVPFSEESLNKYSKFYPELNKFKEDKDREGLLLIDGNDEVAGWIQVNTKTGYLKDININPIYRYQGFGSKLLSDSKIGQKVKFVTLPNNNNSLIKNFFEKNNFNVIENNNATIILQRNNSISEDSGFLISGNTLAPSNLFGEEIDSILDELNNDQDVVTKTESFLNKCMEASVAGLADVSVPINKEPLRKYSQMYDYDEFYEPEESVLVQNEDFYSAKIDLSNPVDIGKNVADSPFASTQRIKKPQEFMIKADATESTIDDDEGIILNTTESTIDDDEGIILNREDNTLIPFEDLSSSIIVGADRYTHNKDNKGAFYIKLMDNESIDENAKEKALSYIEGNEDHLYITGDFHLNHKQRSSNNLYNLAINNINSKIKLDDVLLILGDLGNKAILDKEYIKSFINRLNVSKKILLLGNHDNLHISDYYDMGFCFVGTELETKKYIFTHLPVEPPKNKINVHAHIHGTREYINIPAARHIDVYFKGHGYQIYTLSEYLKFYKTGKYTGHTVYKDFNKE